MMYINVYSKTEKLNRGRRVVDNHHGYTTATTAATSLLALLGGGHLGQLHDQGDRARNGRKAFQSENRSKGFQTAWTCF